MHKTARTTLIIIGSLLLIWICVIAAVFAKGAWSIGKVVKWTDTSANENSRGVARVGGEIADFEIPEGFGSPYGMHFGDVTLVGYASQSRTTHILLTQFPEGTSINTNEVLKLISQYSSDPSTHWVDTHTEVIEEKPVTIRGQESTLTVSEGTSSEGITYRTAVANFQGRGGPSLVMIAGPLDEWDIEMVEAFIAAMQ